MDTPNETLEADKPSEEERLAYLSSLLEDHVKAAAFIKKNIEDASSLSDKFFDADEKFCLPEDSELIAAVAHDYGADVAKKIAAFGDGSISAASVFAGGMNFAGKSLSNCIFRGIDLSNWNLDNITASDCRFIECILPSRLESSLFSNCAFAKCTVADGERIWSIVTFADMRFTECDLSSMNFQRCLASNSDFENCAMHHAVSAVKTVFTACAFKKTDLSNSNFARALFADCTYEQSSFAGCCFKSAVLSGFIADAKTAVITDADFSYANMDGARLTGDILAGAKFAHASLSGAVLEKTIFRNLILEGMSFAGANLEACLFESCDMRHAMMPKASLKTCSFSKCIMEGGFFEELSAEHTGFIDCELSKSSFASACLKDCKILGGRADFCDMHSMRQEGSSWSRCSTLSCRKTDPKLYEAENFV